MTHSRKLAVVVALAFAGGAAIAQQAGFTRIALQDQPPRTVKAGESFFVPAGLVHDGKNIGTGSAKVLATYIVEKGKPVATPVK